MPQFQCKQLLATSIVTIDDVLCSCGRQHRSAQECTRRTRLVFPYRGLYVRHVGKDDAVAEANQVLFFNAGQEYSVSHPVEGGDGNLSLDLAGTVLQELAPAAQLRQGAGIGFQRQRRRIDARAQALVALLRHSLHQKAVDTLEAETLALTLVRRSVGETTSHATSASWGLQRLVDRAKLALSSDLARRWTLSEVASAVGVSPVYLTQVFRQVEGMPLYRYQLNLRLARALDLLGDYNDLTMLALDLGFSSHSHFTFAFRKAYGCSPAEFKRSAHLTK
ncbi:MAG: helix-turn-helix transcriptional regulator [Rhizobiales bacterium]|nr:helix-turn-helix transcriptional regulator [Hyphomicrobiales bacterium]